jgi:hypothetical protein
MYLVKYAYPVLPERFAALEACGAPQIAWFQNPRYEIEAMPRALMTARYSQERMNGSPF